MPGGFDLSLQVSVSASGKSFNTSRSYNTDGHDQADVVVNPATTDFPVLMNVDVSQVKGFVIATDQNILVETNSGSSPTNSFTVKAGIPYVWTIDSVDTFKLTADVTQFFLTNAGGVLANVNIECFYDL